MLGEAIGDEQPGSVNSGSSVSILPTVLESFAHSSPGRGRAAKRRFYWSGDECGRWAGEAPRGSRWKAGEILRDQSVALGAKIIDEWLVMPMIEIIIVTPTAAKSAVETQHSSRAECETALASRAQLRAAVRARYIGGSLGTMHVGLRISLE